MRPPWQRHARLVNLALLALCASLARAQSAAPPPPSPGASALAPSPPASAASPPVSSAAIEEAKQRYTQALELFQEGNFEASLLEFRKSYELSGSFKLLYNMALVSKQMNNHVRAIRFLEQYGRS
jgi:tetratricopeptide (TPR) repeat protein